MSAVDLAHAAARDEPHDLARAEPRQDAVGEGERAERERSATRRDDDVWPFSLAESYGISTWLITCTMPFEAEMSVAPRPAAESCSRVSFEPFSIT